MAALKWSSNSIPKIFVVNIKELKKAEKIWGTIPMIFCRIKCVKF